MHRDGGRGGKRRSPYSWTASGYDVLFPVTSEVDGTKQKNVCMGAYYPVPAPDLLVVVNLDIQRVHVHSCSMTVLNVLNQLYLRNKLSTDILIEHEVSFIS